MEGLRETYVAIGDKSIHLGVANGLQNAKILLDKVIEDREEIPGDRGSWPARAAASVAAANPIRPKS